MNSPLPLSPWSPSPPPRCSHNSPGLKSYTGIPELQRHIGGWKPGFMACWWTEERGGGANLLLGGWQGPLQRERKRLLFFSPVLSGAHACTAWTSDSWSAHSLTGLHIVICLDGFHLIFFLIPARREVSGFVALKSIFPHPHPSIGTQSCDLACYFSYQRSPFKDCFKIFF